MNLSILNTEIQEFISSNLDCNVTSLLLKGTDFLSVETKEIIEQIEAKKRCEKKLPTWFNQKNIYFPNKINIEQTSSEATAKYKASIIHGESIIDLTGGFGVDCFYFSKNFKTVKHCEINETLSKIVAHNYKQLKILNINTIHTDGIDYLKNADEHFNWIYIDPSRRHDSKGKVFFLKDCLPNVPEHLDILFQHSKQILIKTSPLLDISVGISELKYVKTIHVVALNNEVKELLWILEAGFLGEISIETVNLKKTGTEHFSFHINDEKQLEPEYHEPLAYLYEPNSAILKAGGFNSVAKQLKLFKIHKHSHLYTSDALVNFPGRAFIIEKMVPYNKKTFKTLNISKANIATRNFPETVQNIKKKLQIKDGGDTYIFFTTLVNDTKVAIITKKAHA